MIYVFLKALVAMAVLSAVCLIVIGGLLLLVALIVPKTPEYQEWAWGDDEESDCGDPQCSACHPREEA